MADQTCQCGRPTSGAVLCERCTHTLSVALANIAAYHADLDTLRTKQTRYGGTPSKGSVGKAQPLGMDARFARAGVGSEVDWVTRNTVTTWVRVALEEWPPAEWVGPVCRDCLHLTCNQQRMYRPPADTVPSMCAYLLRHLSRIAGRDWAADFLDELLDVEKQLRRLIDRPPDKVFRGPCGSRVPASDGGEVVCKQPLYADPGAPFVRCGTCGSTYDAEARREALLKEAENRLATVRIVARAITTLGDANVSEARIESRINTWVWRGQLQAHGKRVIDGKVRALYRVGDVLDLLADDSQDKTA